jgi:hypothetical protein
MNFAIRALPAAVLAVAAAHAQAGDGRCLWTHLPASKQPAAIDAGLVDGPEALAASFTPQEFLAAENACGATSATVEAVRRAGAGYILQLLAERWLDTKAGLKPERLDEAWTGLDRNARARLQSWALAPAPDPAAREDAYRTFVSALGDPAARHVDAAPKLLTYVQGRVFRDAYEPGF